MKGLLTNVHSWQFFPQNMVWESWIYKKNCKYKKIFFYIYLQIVSNENISDKTFETMIEDYTFKDHYEVNSCCANFF